VGLVLLLAAGFVAAGGRGRIVEIVVLAAGVLLAYLAPWSGGRLLALVSVVAYLGLEAGFGRLNHAHYWQQAFFVIGTFAAVLASATSHLTLETHRAQLAQARRRAEELETELELADTLTRGPRRLDSLEQEIIRSRRHSHRLDLLVARPDGLTEIQQRFGDHGVSAALSAVAEAVALNIRSTDVAFRKGEPDVWVILPETPRENGRVVGERIRLAVAARRLEFAPGESVELTVSIGIASFPNDATSNEDLVAAASRARSRAGDLGGNRTLLHSVPAEAPPGWGIEHDAARV
jgi:diguanylate cyclase (GGDEF)-like protein